MFCSGGWTSKAADTSILKKKSSAQAFPWEYYRPGQWIIIHWHKMQPIRITLILNLYGRKTDSLRTHMFQQAQPVCIHCSLKGSTEISEAFRDHYICIFSHPEWGKATWFPGNTATKQVIWIWRKSRWKDLTTRNKQMKENGKFKPKGVTYVDMLP